MTWFTRMLQKPRRPPSGVFQLENGNAGMAVIKGFNDPLGGSVKSFDGQVDLAVSRQPRFKNPFFR
jgi:hypothetical protein